jgi:hypothetical protein
MVLGCNVIQTTAGKGKFVGMEFLHTYEISSAGKSMFSVDCLSIYLSICHGPTHQRDTESYSLVPSLKCPKEDLSLAQLGSSAP